MQSQNVFADPKTDATKGAPGSPNQIINAFPIKDFCSLKYGDLCRYQKSAGLGERTLLKCFLFCALERVIRSC